ncbi:MAG: ATPase [Nitrospirae bacterium]|nr:ATPase [Nitrospirota bacterium]
MIIKASGRREEFDVKKLAESLVRSGAPDDIAFDIAGKVGHELSGSANTRAIYRMAKRLLRQYNRVSGMKYSIKRALYSLGPAGYQFEQYFARLLVGYGYRAEVGRIVEGYCVKHEVDINATKGDEHNIIECKYHSNSGIPTDVKTALYIHSRFADIKKVLELKSGQGGTIYKGWLVTNTRCTTDAVRYAECVGLKIVSWRYPEKESLEKLIEEKRLYPVTILHSAGRKTLEALFRNDIILAQDIADMDEQTFLARSGLDAATARAIKKEADELCPCTEGLPI